MLRIILVLAACASAAVDLVAPFTVDLVSTSHPFFDTILVTTYLQNRGNENTPMRPFDAEVVTIGIDSFNILGHKMPANYYLAAGNFVEFRNTIQVLRGAFAIHTRADPLLHFGEGGGQVVNNVRSAAFNFYPRVVRDTIVIFDTLVIRDTIRIRDTIKVTVRDTVIKKDTVKYCPPSMAKASAATLRPAVSTAVYNAIGQPVWAGMLREGEYPPVRLKQGLHLLVAGQRTHRFRVAYR